MESFIEIKPITDYEFEAFAQMLAICFIGDYDIPLTDSQLSDLCTDMTQSAKDRITSIDILFANNEPIGFIQYQIDNPNSDWCEFEGYGCIREVYVNKTHRKQGYGRILVTHAEDELKKQSAEHIYLTSDDATGFWLSVGYTDTGEICDKNNNNILIKQTQQ